MGVIILSERKDKAVLAKAEPINEADLAKAAQEIIDEYEAPTRDLSGLVKTIVAALAIIMSLYHLYGAVATIPAQIFRSVHVLFVLVLTFLYYPSGRKGGNRITVWDLVLVALSLVALGYVLVDFENFIYRAVVPSTLDLILGTITILLVLEATRRTVGWILPAIVIAFLVYAYVGPWLPEPWTHRGYDLARIVGHMYMTLEGIFGVPIDVSSTFIILFTIYGAILEYSGAGKFFVDFSFAAMGKRESGAGRTVTLASFLLGTVSGSGVATTVTLGSVAYPLLRRAGYDKETAGAILSSGGIGAVISPPVLGAAAFLIAEILKVSYLEVLKMATIPTILYYLSIFLMIELDSAKRRAARESLLDRASSVSAAPVAKGTGANFSGANSTGANSTGVNSAGATPGVNPTGAASSGQGHGSQPQGASSHENGPAEGLSLGELTRRYWFHFTSLVTIVGFMVAGFTATWAVFWSTLIAVAVSFLRRDTALYPRKLAAALESGAKGILSVAATCASAGIIVGVVTLTGLGLKFSGIILDLAHGQLFLTLLYTGLILLVLGLALPITASYIVAAVMTAPALIKLGVPEYAAHMFIFYYAVLSEVSPPVALSPVAAAALTGGNPFRTMMITWKYTLPAFLVPFMFSLHPSGLALLLVGSPGEIIWSTLTAVFGIAGLVLGVGGYVIAHASWLERILLVAGGIFLLYPLAAVDMAGFAAVAGGLALHWMRIRAGRALPA